MTTGVLISAVVASSLGLIVYTWLEAKKRAPHLFDTESGGLLLEADGTEITVIEPGRRERKIGWTAVRAVTIRTTDSGPLVDDVFWDLRLADGSVVTFSNDGPGVEAFMAEAPVHLPGFEHEAIIDAMTSTDNATFPVWRAGDEPADGP